MAKQENPIQEILQVLVPLAIILAGIWAVSTYQRHEQNLEKQEAHEQALKRTKAIRKPFEPLLDQIPSILASIKNGRWSSLERKQLKSLERPPTPCIVVDVTDSPVVWTPWCSWPTTVRAETSEEVKSVILFERERIKDTVYPYQRGQGAYMEKQGYRLDFQMWIVDWEDKEIISGGLVQGQPLPESVEISNWDFSNSDVIGEPPDLKNWIVP